MNNNQINNNMDQMNFIQGNNQYNNQCNNQCNTDNYVSTPEQYNQEAYYQGLANYDTQGQSQFIPTDYNSYSNGQAYDTQGQSQFVPTDYNSYSNGQAYDTQGQSQFVPTDYNSYSNGQAYDTQGQSQFVPTDYNSYSNGQAYDTQGQEASLTPHGVTNQADYQATWNLQDVNTAGDAFSPFSVDHTNTAGDSFSPFSMDQFNTNNPLPAFETDTINTADTCFIQAIPEENQQADKDKKENSTTSSKSKTAKKTSTKSSKKNKCESNPFESGYLYQAEIEIPVFARGVEQFKMPLSIQFGENEDEESYIKNRLAKEHNITEANYPNYTVNNRGTKFVLSRINKTQKANYLG